MGFPLINPAIQFFDNAGEPLAGGKLFVYVVSTTTKTTTWTNAELSSENANPIILDSAGRCSIFVTDGVEYKYVLAPADDTDPPTNPIWTRDKVKSPQALSQSSIGATLYPRTAAEIAAAVTPTDYGYPSVYARRYGAPVDGATSANAAIGTADTVAQQEDSAIVFSPGIYYIPSNLTITADVVMQPGAMFRVANAVTLKLLGEVTAPAQKIYDLVGTGAVMFGSAANQWAYVRSIVHPEHWGATGVNGSGNDTVAVQAAFDSQRPVVFLQHYLVTQVRIRKNEQHIDFNGFELLGIGGSALKSVLDIKCGYSTLINVQVSAQFDSEYECAIHWYTNDTATYYPGFNRIYGLWPRNALIGLCIGALPSQADPIAAQGVVVAEDLATNAPLSESTVFGFQSYDCVIGVYGRQPNGKVSFVGPNINGNSLAWTDYGSSGYTDASACALIINNNSDGATEIHLTGGSLEQVYEATGNLFQVTHGNLTLDGTTIEGVCGAFISGSARIVINHPQNFGFNMTANYALFKIKDDAEGWLNITNARPVSPVGHLDNGTVAAFKAVADIGGSFSPNYGKFVVNLLNTELRDQPFIGTTTYVPPAQGVEIRMVNCEITKYNTTDRLVLLRVSDGPNVLSGAVDVSNYLITAYGANGNASSGGWTFAVSNAGTCNWGSASSGITYSFKTLDKSLRIQAPSSENTTATSAAFAVHPEKTYILRGLVKSGTSGSTARISATFFKWDDSASATASANIISVPESQLGATVQHILGRVTIPKDAVKMKLVLYVENGATMYVTDLALN